MNEMRLKVQEIDTSRGNRERKAGEDMRKNWWPVAYSQELGADAPYGVSLFGEPLVLFRDAEGAVNCLQDLCPHKSVPLSIGKVQHGTLVCRYHGWHFSGSGQCQVPTNMINNPAACRYSYPTLDDGLLIWVYPDHSEPIPFVQPLTSFLQGSSEKLKYFKSYMFDFNQPWDLWVAGFLDLLHARHVHGESFSTGQHSNLQYHYDSRISPCAMLAQPKRDKWYALHAYLAIVPTREQSNRHFLTLIPTSQSLPDFLVKTLFHATTTRKAVVSSIVYEDFYIAEKQFERMQQGASQFGIGGTSPLSDKFSAWYRSHLNDKVWFKRYSSEGAVFDSLDNFETRLTRTQRDTGIEIATSLGKSTWSIRDLSMESCPPVPLTWKKRGMLDLKFQKFRDHVGVALQGKS